VPSVAEARDWVSKARRGNPWRYRNPDEEVEIGPLVSPLRFDVLLRGEFFQLYAERRELYRSDFEGFARLAREHRYFVWFERVMCPAWQPHVLVDEDRLAAAWAKRLRASAALYDSFERGGFDERCPITLYEGRTVLPTPSGKRIARTVYAGDGNHRLALVMATGASVLPPSQYRIKRFRRLMPSDTTPRLVAARDVDAQRYADFLRMGYPSVEIAVVEGNVVVAGTGPQADEVRQLVAADRPRA
jgi:hypothetical protein